MTIDDMLGVAGEDVVFDGPRVREFVEMLMQYPGSTVGISVLDLLNADRIIGQWQGGYKPGAFGYAFGRTWITE